MKTKAYEEKWFKTRDGIGVAANFYPGNKRSGRLIILAPGFAKYKDGPPMGELCGELALYGDVLCIDFRGVGKSQGRYGFGAKEHYDLEALLKWGRPYRQRILVGLSMGSYISLRTAHDFPKLVDRLLLVSVPSRFEDVLKTFGPIRQAWAISQDWPTLKRRILSPHNIFFRWDNPFRSKPDGADMAKRLKAPVFFLVGGKDRLVVKNLSRRIYDNASNQKGWTEIPEGNHAEFLYVENQGKFNRWLRLHLREKNK